MTLWIFLATFTLMDEPMLVTYPSLLPQYAFTSEQQCKKAIEGKNRLVCVPLELTAPPVVDSSRPYMGNRCTAVNCR